MVPVAASEGDEVMPRDAAAVATFSFCSRPTDGAAPLKPGDAVRWMLAASPPPRPPVSTWVDVSGRTEVNALKNACNAAGFWGGGGSQPQEQQSN